VEVDGEKRKFKRESSFMSLFYVQVCRKKANEEVKTDRRNEIKREKLENKRSCDMSRTLIGIRVKNERIITVGLASALGFLCSARSQIRLKHRKHDRMMDVLCRWRRNQPNTVLMQRIGNVEKESKSSSSRKKQQRTLNLT
jgi:hypothetical protein